MDETGSMGTDLMNGLLLKIITKHCCSRWLDVLVAQSLKWFSYLEVLHSSFFGLPGKANNSQFLVRSRLPANHNSEQLVLLPGETCLPKFLASKHRHVEFLGLQWSRTHEQSSSWWWQPKHHDLKTTKENRNRRVPPPKYYADGSKNAKFPCLTAFSSTLQEPFDRFGVASTTRTQRRGRAGCGSGRTTPAVGPRTTRRWASPSRQRTTVSSPGWTWLLWASATSLTLKTWPKSTGRRSVAGASSGAPIWLTRSCLARFPSPTMPGGPCPCPARGDCSGWMFPALAWASGWAAAGLEMAVRTPVGPFPRLPSPHWGSPVPASSAC